MIETFEKEINLNKYSVTQLPARRALKLQAKILKLIGPALSEMFVAASNDLNTADKSITSAVKLLMSELDDKNFDVFIMEILQGVRKNGVELTERIVDLEFAGNLNELFLLIQYIIEVNFQDFFQEGGILKGLTQKDPQ